jgi:hypothetical protein
MNVHYTTLICMAILGAVSLAMFGCHEQEETKREAMRAGLIQKQNPGSYHVIWDKPEQ